MKGGKDASQADACSDRTGGCGRDDPARSHRSGSDVLEVTLPAAVEGPVVFPPAPYTPSREEELLLEQTRAYREARMRVRTV